MSDPDILASIAVQDQEWAEAKDWLTNPDNALAAAAMTLASLADDPKDFVELLQSHEAYAHVAQRMCVLVIVEVLHRQHEQAEAGNQ